MLGRRGVGCVCRNRVPGQLASATTPIKASSSTRTRLSSFNAPPCTHITDANEMLWPIDGDQVEMDCLATANDVLGVIIDDLHEIARCSTLADRLRPPPPAWGAVIPTASIGHLSFWKPAPADLSLQGDLWETRTGHIGLYGLFVAPNGGGAAFCLSRVLELTSIAPGQSRCRRRSRLELALKLMCLTFAIC